MGGARARTGDGVDLDAPGVDAIIVGRARQGAVEVEARLGDGRHALVPEGVEGLASHTSPNPSTFSRKHTKPRVKRSASPILTKPGLSHPYSLASGLRCDTFLTGDAG